MTSFTSRMLSMKYVLRLALALAAVLVIGSCSDDETPPTGPVDDLRARFNLQTLGPIPYPPENPPRAERIALGRMLSF